MQDRETGAEPSDPGVQGPQPRGSAPRQVWRPQAPGGPITAGAAVAGAPDVRNSPRKRRKRKRGRKVFVRDGSTPASSGAVPAGSPGQGAPAAADPPAPDVALDAPPTPASSPGAPAPPPQPRRAWMGGVPAFAALDLGTNNCRLLVAIPGRPGEFRVVDAFSRIVRLGEGLSASGRLAGPAMDRAVEALKVCAEKLAARSIRRARLIATEACRAAANGPDFLDRVLRETGLVLEVIDRETEARLAVSGCGSLVERETRGVVLFDIGGGSSEIALIDVSERRSPRLADHIAAWTSLPVGVVSLAERFGGRDVTPRLFAAMVEAVSEMLARFEGRGSIDHLAGDGAFHLLGTSGTVTTLAGVHLELDRYDRRRVDGLWMDRASVDAMVARLLGWSFDERVASPCIGADRADLVLAGCAILEAIRRRWPAERLRVADRGLREGILSELMAEEGVWRRGGRTGGRP